MKVYKVILILLFNLFTSLGYGQQLNFQFKSVADIIENEKKQFGILKDTIKNFGILVSPIDNDWKTVNTQVLLYNRVKDNFFPNLHVWYHFDKDFKNIKGIRFYWGLYNPSFNPKKDSKILENLSLQEDLFSKKYLDLKKQLVNQFGNPIKVKTIANNELRFIESIFWETDKEIVNLSIEFSRKLRNTEYGLDGNYVIEIMVTKK